MSAEQAARQNIDQLLQRAGWHVCDVANADLHVSRGVAIREFPLTAGFGFADYLLYVDGKAAGVVEAKKEGVTLTGVETQSARYAQGLPPTLPSWRRPLPFLYESTGVETHFTNGLDPQPRARPTFAFHRPDSLAAWLTAAPGGAMYATGEGPAPTATDAQGFPATFLSRVQQLPPLVEAGLWPAQIVAIRNLEKSLAANKPRALIQMATGSGKTFTAISFIYRLIKFAGARRVLFLVDRGNLGRQAKKEFDQYVSPYNNYKFGEEYIVQHLTNNNLDTTARVTISTIQRMFSMLKGRDLPEEDEEISVGAASAALLAPEPIDYNPQYPIETFDKPLSNRCVLGEFALIVFCHYMHAGRFVDEGTITTNIAHLSLGRLAAVEFPVPPLPEQHRIVAEVDRRLSFVREVEAAVDANLKRAQVLRQAVLAKAFGGGPASARRASNPASCAA